MADVDANASPAMEIDASVLFMEVLLSWSCDALSYGPPRTAPMT
jgi:hypothetical protein